VTKKISPKPQKVNEPPIAGVDSDVLRDLLLGIQEKAIVAAHERHRDLSTRMFDVMAAMDATDEEALRAITVINWSPSPKEIERARKEVIDNLLRRLAQNPFTKEKEGTKTT
jgi:hypothetical protein